MENKKKWFIGIAVLIFIMLVIALPNVWERVKNRRELPFVMCQERLKGLRFDLDSYYLKCDHYPTSKGDEFFRELQDKTNGGIPLCPVNSNTNKISYSEEVELFNKKIDYETWPEGFPPEKILTSPPDGYPLLWDKKGNHKEGRNVLILLKDAIPKDSLIERFDPKYGYIREYSPVVFDPEYGPIQKYSPVVIFLNENDFEKYLNKYRNQ